MCLRRYIDKGIGTGKDMTLDERLEREGYDARFTGEDIRFFKEDGIAPEIANAYSPRFEGYQILKMHYRGCTPEIVNTYGPGSKMDEILLAEEIGFRLKEQSESQKIKMRDLISKVCTWTDKRRGIDKSMFWPADRVNYVHTCLAVGNSSIIILEKSMGGTLPLDFDASAVYKFSTKLNREYALLEKIWKKTKSENIIQVVGTYKDVKEEYKGMGRHISDWLKYNKTQWNNSEINEEEYKEICGMLQSEKEILKNYTQNSARYMLMIHIPGDSIENVMKQRTLEPVDALRYGKDIMTGLMDMRQAGVWYHRDINPRNIMITENGRRALILDLEYATEDINKPSRKTGNRRFNGPNDLSSLGQLMYYMATGTSVFAETKEHKSDLSDIADEIQKNRNKTYKDQTGQKMNEIYAKIDENISDKKLSYMIKECLTAKHTDYDRIYGLFQKG